MPTGKTRKIGKLGGLAAVAVFALALSVSGLASAQDATPLPYEAGNDLAALGGGIVADGSSTVGPMTEAVAEEFGLMMGDAGGGDVQIEISISGTGGGFERFCIGETDLQNASRPIAEDEIANCSEAGVDYYQFEIAYDGIAVVVNAANDYAECLTVEQLNMMWGPEDTVTNWNGIDSSFPDAGIALYGPGTDSGTFDYFTGVINGEEGVSTTDFFPSEDDNQLVQGVAGDENALGYFGLAYYENNADQLKLVSVDGGSGCVAPTPETVGDGSYAPLSRPLYLYVNAESLTRPEVQEFVRFYLANAALLAADVGYVASPAQASIDAQLKLEAAIAGDGTPDSSAESS